MSIPSTWQERAIQQLSRRFEQTAEGQAFVLTGSCAAEDVPVDAWSDVDAKIILAEEAVTRYYDSTGVARSLRADHRPGTPRASLDQNAAHLSGGFPALRSHLHRGGKSPDAQRVGSQPHPRALHHPLVATAGAGSADRRPCPRPPPIKTRPPSKSRRWPTPSTSRHRWRSPRSCGTIYLSARI